MEIELSLRKSKIKSLALRILLYALCFLAAGLLNHWWKQSSPNRDDVKLKELYQLASQIPVFPTFSESNTDDSSRAMDAGVYKSYFSSAKYDDVKQFYVRELGNRGWQLSSEENGRSLDFKKGDFRISVEYVGSNTNSWNYAVDFMWKNK